MHNYIITKKKDDKDDGGELLKMAGEPKKRSHLPPAKKLTKGKAGSIQASSFVQADASDDASDNDSDDASDDGRTVRTEPAAAAGAGAGMTVYVDLGDGTAAAQTAVDVYADATVRDVLTGLGKTGQVYGKLSKRINTMFGR